MTSPTTVSYETTGKASSASSDIDSDEEPCYYEARSTPTKGQALFATRNIKPGTLVLRELPLITLPRATEESAEALETAVRRLSKHDRKIYRSLFDAQKSGMSKDVSIWNSNRYNIDGFADPAVSDASMTGGSAIGAVASRVNHSCVPNVYMSFLPAEGVQGKGVIFFHAFKSISRGKELVSCYDRQIFRTGRERQKGLLLDYGFRCACEACVPTNSFWKKSNERRLAMRECVLQGKKLEKEWERLSEGREEDEEMQKRRKEVVKKANEALIDLEALLMKEGLTYLPLANVYQSLAKWAVRGRDDVEGGLGWTRKEHEVSVGMSGSSSPEK